MERGEEEVVEEQTKAVRHNAFLYCKFRDEQFALYDGFAKEQGMTMNMLLVVNALFYAADGLTQSEICTTVHHSKQTVSLIVKKLVAEGRAELAASEVDGRAKVVRLTEEGRAWAEYPVRHITLAEDNAMAMLSPKEQEALVALSRQFTKNLAALVRGEEDVGRQQEAERDENDAGAGSARTERRQGPR